MLFIWAILVLLHVFLKPEGDHGKIESDYILEKVVL